MIGFKTLLGEAYDDEEFTVEACPECYGKSSACPFCGGFGYIMKEIEEADPAPEPIRMDRGTKLKNGYNSGDDYVTGGY